MEAEWGPSVIAVSNTVEPEFLKYILIYFKQEWMFLIKYKTQNEQW